MLPKIHRLTKREDFAVLYKRGGYSSVYGGLTIKYLKTENLHSRLGFPIGKNFSKRAVARNRARRVLRAGCFQFIDLLKPGYDIIILLSSGYKDMEFKKMADDLKKVFAKANLLK